jgi:hypothetical protein
VVAVVEAAETLPGHQATVEMDHQAICASRSTHEPIRTRGRRKCCQYRGVARKTKR